MSAVIQPERCLHWVPAVADVTYVAEASAQAELGNPSQPDEVAAMLEYAPLLNIRQPNGTRQYPAMLITVGAIPDLHADAAIMP